MFTMIGGDGREYGPVTAEQLITWIGQNRANRDTRVKRAGSDEWKTLGDFPEFARALGLETVPPTLPPGPPPLPGAETAAPAPAAAPAEPTSRPLDPAEAAARPYPLSIRACVSTGWDTVVGRFGLCVGGFVVVWLVSVIANLFVGAVPIAGILLSVVIGQIFNAGIAYLLLRVARGENAELADGFAGFSRNLGPLAIYGLLLFGVMASFIALGFGPLLYAFYKAGVFTGQTPDPALLFPWILLTPLAILPMIYFGVIWLFVPILLVDRQLTLTEALAVSRRAAGQHWLRLLGLYLVFIPIQLAGLLCFLVGVFFTTTWMAASLNAAYRAAFDRTEKTPPAP